MRVRLEQLLCRRVSHRLLRGMSEERNALQGQVAGDFEIGLAQTCTIYPPRRSGYKQRFGIAFDLKEIAAFEVMTRHHATQYP